MNDDLNTRSNLEIDHNAIDCKMESNNFENHHSSCGYAVAIVNDYD